MTARQSSRTRFVVPALLALGLAGCGGGENGPSAASLKALLLPGLPELPAKGVCDEQKSADLDDELVPAHVGGVEVSCRPQASGDGTDLNEIVFIEFRDAATASSMTTSLTTRVLGTERNGHVWERQELDGDTPPAASCLVVTNQREAQCFFASGKFLVGVMGNQGGDVAVPQRVTAVLAKWMEDQ